VYTLANHRFVNWARNVRSTPHTYFLPENTDDVRAIIQKAAAENRKVRVVGAGHSWSAAAATDDFMVSLDKLNRMVQINKDTLQVTVQGGMRLKHLHNLLYAEGLAMPNIGSISEQTVAGAISTGTHGTGITHQILASQVVSLKLVNGLGELVEP
jgi:FAD/FMN-containing dehydrogenase